MLGLITFCGAGFRVPRFRNLFGGFTNPNFEVLSFIKSCVLTEGCMGVQKYLRQSAQKQRWWIAVRVFISVEDADCLYCHICSFCKCVVYIMSGADLAELMKTVVATLIIECVTVQFH